MGCPQKCLRQIARYSELGFTDICLRLFYPKMTQQEVLGHIKLVGNEVLLKIHRM